MTEAVQEQEVDTPTETPQPPAGEQLARPNSAATIGFGMSATNWDQGFRIANQLAKSALVPKAYHDKAQDIVVAMQLGAELGLPPMQALQSIAVINGRPGVYGDGFLAVIMASPAYLKHREYYVVNGEERLFLTTDDLKLPDTAAVTSFWRKGNPEPFTATFSIADATRAQLLGKQGPWTQYPARMMRFRARGFAGRDAFASELRGMKTAEELQDLPDVTVDMVEPPLAGPRRISEKASNEPQTSETLTVPADHSPATAAAKPAGQSKTPAATFQQTGTGSVVRRVRITDTQVIAARNGEGDTYEIKGDTAEAGKIGATQTWLTKDEQLYRAAASCEGSDSRFTVTCHPAKVPEGKKTVSVITGLAGE